MSNTEPSTYIPEPIQELLKKRKVAEIGYDPRPEFECFVYILSGFYKSGKLYIYDHPEEGLVALARYDRSIGDGEKVRSLNDIISINYDWWRKSMHKLDEWGSPDSQWKDLLKEYGYIEVKTKTIEQVEPKK